LLQAGDRLEAYSHRNSFPWLRKGAVSDVQMSLKKLPKKERHTGCNCSRIRSLHNPVTVQVGATALTHCCGAISIASPLTSKRIAWLLTITPEALLGCPPVPDVEASCDQLSFGSGQN